MEALLYFSTKVSGNAEKATLELLGSDESAYTAAMRSSKGLAWIDLFDVFPALIGSVKLETLLKHMPLNHPRSYSIASSREIVGKRTVELCVGRLVYTAGDADEKRFRVGVCSNFLNLAPLGTEVMFRHETYRPFHLPTNTSSPLFMVAAGTGAAPIRGLVQERLAYAQRGIKLGKALLLLGFRDESSAIFVDEFRAARGCGALSNVIVAYSRSVNAKKERVDSSIRENVFTQHNLKALLDEKEQLHVYICGSALMSAGVVEAMESFMGKKVVAGIIDGGRLHKDIFGELALK